MAFSKPSTGGGLVTELPVPVAEGGTGSTTSGATVHIYTAADLPAASGGVRTSPVSATIWHLHASVDLGTDRIAAGGDLTLKADDKALISLETTHASALLASSGFSVTLWQIQLINDSGPTLAIVSGAGKLVTIDHCVFNNAGMDTIVGATSALACVIRNSRWAGGTTGVTISANWTALVIRTVGFLGLGSSADMLTLGSGATFVAVSIFGCQFITTAAGQTALTIDAGITPTVTGEVTNNTFSGTGTFLGAGVGPNTDFWAFIANPGIEDSAVVGDISISGNSTETTISGSDTATVVATGSPWALGAAAERFTVSSPDLVYAAEEPVHAIVLYGGTVEAAMTNKDLRLRLFHEGSEVDHLNFSYRTTPINGFRVHVLTLATDDTLELRCSNQDDTTNMTVLDAQIAVHKVAVLPWLIGPLAGFLGSLAAVAQAAGIV